MYGTIRYQSLIKRNFKSEKQGRIENFGNVWIALFVCSLNLHVEAQYNIQEKNRGDIFNAGLSNFWILLLSLSARMMYL